MPGDVQAENVSRHGDEVKHGERFGFGKNWARFLSVLNEERIAIAEQSLQEKLEVDTLASKSFLDIGSGSGLFSLAARRLGARVRSFDYDPQSVACTAELKRRYFPDDPDWVVEQGSALDRGYLQSLGQFDIVYSWGVLHHTGDMWRALEYAAGMVAANGFLFLSIYNDQGMMSRVWRRVKKTYNTLPAPLKLPFAIAIAIPLEGSVALICLVKLKPMDYIRGWTQYRKHRGMSRWHDIVDWVGGYPFEVAKPEQIFDFYRRKGFELVRLKTAGGGLGCNEFVFVRKQDAG